MKPIILDKHGKLITDFTEEELAFFASWSPTSFPSEKDVQESLRVSKQIKAAASQCWFNARKAIRRMADQTYRVYRTHSGCRIICTSMTFDRKDTIKDFLGDRLLRFLQADPKYAALCQQQRSYRARLTPKPWRVSSEEPNHVCDFVTTIGSGEVHPDLVEQLRLHDEMTLAIEGGSMLA